MYNTKPYLLSMIKSHEDIDAYKSSKSLYPQIVNISKKFPREGWHLRDQLCRSANSIHANIAEGYGRSSREFKMFLTRSLGSCNETRSHIEDAIALRFIDIKDGQQLLNEYAVVGKRIYRLRQRWL